jgi:hypothetical protein
MRVNMRTPGTLKEAECTAVPAARGCLPAYEPWRIARNAPEAPFFGIRSTPHADDAGVAAKAASDHDRMSLSAADIRVRCYNVKDGRLVWLGLPAGASMRESGLASAGGLSPVETAPGLFSGGSSRSSTDVNAFFRIRTLYGV